MPTSRWFHPRGSLARDGWESVVDDALPGWQHTALRVAELADGREVRTGPGAERLVVPLSGSFLVELDEGDGVRRIALDGRRDVFSGPTDTLYLGAAATAVISGSGRVAVAGSPTATHLPSVRLAADRVPVELRGAGAASREVRDLGTPPVLRAERLIVCEVLTPAGNWSSYPPHKHDEHRPGVESRLEEIYYFEAAPERAGRGAAPGEGAGAAPVAGPAGRDAAYGLFSAHSSPAGEIEISARVRTGDVALVPHGYHGPAAAAPGYDLYYLNVMAGPDPERVWLVQDDPDHAWVRGTWAGQRVDPRLPFDGEEA